MEVIKIKLKKLLYLITFGVLLSFFYLNNVYAETTRVKANGIGAYYHGYQAQNGNWGRFGQLQSFKIANGKYQNLQSYCIAPGEIWYGSKDYQININSVDSLSIINNTQNKKENKLTQEQLNTMSMIAYYGYGYKNHIFTNYIVATQMLIYRVMDNQVFTNINCADGDCKKINDPTAIKSLMNEIQDLVDNHYVKPSFDSTKYDLMVGESLTLNDINGVLSNYEVSNCNNCTATINGNNLTLTANSNGKIEVSLTKKSNNYNNDILFLTSSESQNMLVPGNLDPIFAKVYGDAYAGYIEILKKDANTITSQGQATLQGAIYGIYTLDDVLVTQMTTDINGYAKSELILRPNTDYYVKEITPPKGYYIDNMKHYFNLNDQTNITLNLTDNVIKNYVSILKQYGYVDGNTTFLNAESGIVFEIYYPDGTKYGEVITDKNGYATFEIAYGVWRLHQVNTNIGFEKINDFYITVDENSSKEQYYNILNNKLSAYLQVVKIDYETKETIAIADTTFKILNTDTNQYVSQFVGGKIINEFKTDSNGIFMTDLKLEAGNYKLIEILNPHGYLINSEGINFTIGDDSDYTYTSYGPVVTIYYENKAIKGQIEVNKNGEKFVVTDTGFMYEHIKLENIEFNIFATEDIFSADGKYLLYKKDELVDTIVTNKDGYAKSKLLPLGKYYLMESNTKDCFVLDLKKYYVTLEEIDNKTEIVYETINILNYLKKGKLEFTKTDFVTGDSIPNTLIEIYTSSDKLIFSGKTNSNGKIIIDNIPLGKYYIIEKEPSVGYIITDKKIFFEIKEDGQIIKSTLTNKKIKSIIKIYKTDEKNNPLQGVKIGIFNLDNELIGIYFTNENGMIELELEYGSYFYQELSTVDNHILNDEKIYFDVVVNGEIIESYLINETIDVPNTFKSTKKIIELIGIITIFVGMGYIIYGKNRNK